MPHPWDWEEGWIEDGVEYYNVTPSSPGWNDYEQTVGAYYYNSLGFPTEIGLFILGLFSVAVLLIGLKHAIVQLPNVQRRLRRYPLVKSFETHFLHAPLLRRRYQTPIPLLGRFVSIQLPLRVDSLSISILALINLLSIVAMYKPYRQNNLYWPDRYSEILRYVSDRSGVVATMQFPLLFLLSGRNNLVSWLTGVSFDKCMIYHRWIARFVFVQVVVHAVGYSLLYAKDGYYSTMFVDPYMRWGTTATVAFGPLIFFSLRWLRQQAYEIFVAIHIAMAIVCVVGTYYHIQLLNVQVAGQYNDYIFVIYASVAFWSFDKLVRLARIVRYSVKLQLLPFEITLSRVKLSLISNSPRGIIVRHSIQLKAHVDVGGQFVQLWLPRIEPFTSHPFTVADLVHDAQGTSLILYSKVQSGATLKLLNAATSQQQPLEVALVEGFYGHIPDLTNFNQAIFASAGIGITLCMPLFKRRVQSGLSAHMIWIIPEYELLAVLADMLNRVQDLSLHKQSIEADEEVQAEPARTITVYVTQKSDVDSSSSVDDNIATLDQQAVDTQEVQAEKAFKEGDEQQHMHLRQLASAAGIDLRIVDMHGQRPVLHTLIGDAASAALSNGLAQTCLVSCGPESFCDDSRRACRTYGLHYFEEAFQW